MQRHSYARPVWFLITIIAGLFGLWSWLFETKLYGLLLNLIDQYFEVYYPDLTGFLATLLLIAIPFFIACRAPYTHEYELRYPDLVRRLKTRIILLAISVLIFAGFSAASYNLYQNAATENQESIVVDLESELPANMWLRKVALINAKPLTKHINFSKDLRQESLFSLRRYTPIVNNSVESNQVSFVESFTSDSSKLHKSKAVNMKGFIRPRLLPAVMRVKLEASGLDLANIVYVVEDQFFDIKPYLKWCSILLLLVTALLLIRLLLSPLIHHRKLLNAWQHQKGYSKTKNFKEDIAPWR